MGHIDFSKTSWACGWSSNASAPLTPRVPPTIMLNSRNSRLAPGPCAPSSIPMTRDFLIPPTCRRPSNQPLPNSPGELIRCAYESLALKYSQVLSWLEELTATRIEVIHIVGGGSKSEILNQFTADACQRPVLAGPVEATAMGNLLAQARAGRELSTLADIRTVVRQSSDLKCYNPGPSAPWLNAAARLASLKVQN